MIPVTIALTLFRTPWSLASGQMIVTSSDPCLSFFYYAWSIDGKHALMRATRLVFDVCQERYVIQVFRAGEQESVARLVGSVNWNGFEIEEGEQVCRVTLEQEILPGTYYEGRAFSDPTQPCICCGYVDYRQSRWSRGCLCDILQRCPACHKCPNHCSCAADPPQLIHCEVL